MIVTRRALFLIVPVLWQLAGCGEGDGGLAPDAGRVLDATLTDGSIDPADAALDAGSGDDAGPDDDGGAPEPDAGPSCASSETVCDGRCADLASDVHHCGACGVDCDALPGVVPGAATCVAGACRLDACAPGRADCDGDADDGCETDVTTATDCGACGRACIAGVEMCSAGDDGYACATSCGGATPDRCGDRCVDLAGDASQCGTCGNVCPGVTDGVAICAAGTCDFECPAGHHACDGACVSDDLTTSCGASCTPCASPPGAIATCDGISCGYECVAGRADCDGDASNGCEAELDAPASCGACDVSCAAPEGGAATCDAGACGFACDAGRHACGAACALDTSVASCGSSCTPCPVPANAVATCDGAACGFSCLPGFADCDGDAANGCELSLSDPAGGVIFCEGFEQGLGAWSVESYWGRTGEAYRGSSALRAYWGGTTAGCGITRSTYLARDLDLSGATSATLEYRHRAQVGSSDRLWVLASTDGGATWAVIDGPGGSGSYALRRVDLAAYAGAPALRIGFRFRNVCGDAYGVTWWVDDVAVHVTR